MVKELVTKHYDFKMGLIGAIGMAIIVYFVNADHGFWAAIPAALKQGVYTLIAGGFLTRLCERIALNMQEPISAHILAMLVPSTLAVVLTLGVHYMRGTPEPYNSTVPTMLLAPLSFLLWAWYIRRRNFEPIATAISEEIE